MTRRLACGLAMLLALAPRAAAQGFDPAEDRPLRVLGEVGGGVVGGMVGGFVGGVLAGGVCALAFDDGDFGCILPAFIGGAVGGFAGMSLGVWAAGDLAEANGGAGWLVLGQTAGLAGAITLFALLEDTLDDEAIWYVTFVALPLTGAILGYELSTEAEPGEAAGALVVPLTFTF